MTRTIDASSPYPIDWKVRAASPALSWLAPAVRQHQTSLPTTRTTDACDPLHMLLAPFWLAHAQPQLQNSVHTTR